MKNMRMIMALCSMALLLTVASCKKDNTTTDTSCGSGLLCASIDGASFTANPYNSSTGIFGNNTYNGSYAQLVASSTSTGGYFLKVYGNNGGANSTADRQIDFTITQLPTAGGTYTTQAGSASFEYYAGSGSSQEQYITDASHTGTVTITSLDTINNYVSGTFSYTATEAPGNNYTPTQHTITSGNFTKVMIKR